MVPIVLRASVICRRRRAVASGGGRWRTVAGGGGRWRAVEGHRPQGITDHRKGGRVDPSSEVQKEVQVQVYVGEKAKIKGQRFVLWPCAAARKNIGARRGQARYRIKEQRGAEPTRTSNRGTGGYQLSRIAHSRRKSRIRARSGVSYAGVKSNMGES